MKLQSFKQKHPTFTVLPERKNEVMGVKTANIEKV